MDDAQARELIDDTQARELIDDAQARDRYTAGNILSLIPLSWGFPSLPRSHFAWG